jgi:K+-transporting ATPase c subunit
VLVLAVLIPILYCATQPAETDTVAADSARLISEDQAKDPKINGQATLARQLERGFKADAQPFTKDEYFQPRPSAASYDASASAASTYAASNYLLRNRVAGALGPIVKYKSGPKAGQLVAPDVEAWFQQDKFQGNPHVVAQWADLH